MYRIRIKSKTKGLVAEIADFQNGVKNTTAAAQPRNTILRRESTGISELLRLVERQCAHTFPRRGKDRVRYRRANSRHNGLTDPSGRLCRRRDVDFDARHLVDAQQGVIVKIRLFHSSGFQGNPLMEDGTQAKGYTAFDLRPDNIRVNGLTAIDGTDHAIYFYASVGTNGHFGHVGYGRTEGVVPCDSASFAGRQRCSPIGFSRRKFQDPEVARKFGEGAITKATLD